MEYVLNGSDPTAVAVVLEDSVAVLGVAIAAAAILMAKYTGSSTFDALGSILIGGLLGFVAVFLIRRNTLLLTGVSPAPEELAQFSKALEDHPGVGKVVEMKGEMMGSAAMRLKADIDFDGRYVGKRVLDAEDVPAAYAKIKDSEEVFHEYLLGFAERVVDRVADVVDEIETDIQSHIPGQVFIDLEAD